MKKKTAKPTFARRTISIAVDLDKRMSRIEDVNWSRVAADAFEKKLGELAAKKVEKNMDDVIQRLRAERIEHEEGMAGEGLDAGKKWAQRAKYAALKRLTTWWNSMNDHERNQLIDSCTDEMNSNFNYVLASAVLGEDRPDFNDIRDFWDQAIGEDDRRRDDHEFTVAFAEGAVDFFDEVQSKL